MSKYPGPKMCAAPIVHSEAMHPDRDKCVAHDEIVDVVRDMQRVICGDKVYNLPGIVDTLKSLEANIADLTKQIQALTADRASVIRATVAVSVVLSTIIPVIVALLCYIWTGQHPH